MTSPALETLKAAKALKDARFDEAQAEAVVAAVDNVVRGHAAPLESGIATIADNMATIADNMATIAEEYVNAAIAGLRAEIAVEFKTLYRHLWVMGTSIVGVTVVLNKLFA